MSIDKSRRKFASLALSLSAPALLNPAIKSSLQQPAAESLGVYFNVRDFGAAGNGVRLDTPSIQAAVDAGNRAGGGVIYFPSGTYLTGTIFLKSGVTLHLAEGSKLLGSPDLNDYPVTIPEFRSYTDNYTERSIIYAEKADRIGITGRGILDGQMSAFQRTDFKLRPFMIRMVQCRDISISDVTFYNSAMWVQHYLACEDLRVHGIRVRVRELCCTSNHDGLDIDSCQRVRISDCDIDSEDDAIVLKSTSALPCRDVTITNCILSSKTNAIKCGTESNGGFENITINNVSVYNTGFAGVALEIVDGGTMDRVTISNMVMRDTGCPIFIRLGDRGRPFQSGQPRPGVGMLRNITISNIQATGASNIGCSITGIPARAIENIIVENVRISFAGGGTRGDALRPIPELIEAYPECVMFGKLSAFGFFARHINGLSLRNLMLSFSAPDQRHVIVCDDVNGLNLENINAASQPDSEAFIRLHDVRNASVHLCRTLTTGTILLRVTGELSSVIRMFANNYSNFSGELELSAEVPESVIQSCTLRPIRTSSRRVS